MKIRSGNYRIFYMHIFFFPRLDLQIKDAQEMRAFFCGLGSKQNHIRRRDINLPRLL